jgi:Kdo2-lipid IVA lauroyltransferase/acyltransferase
MKVARKKLTFGKRLRHRFEAAVLRTLAWLVPKFPRRFVRRVGAALGALVYRLSPTLRRVSLENLEVAFGDTMTCAEKLRIARASLQNVGATFLGLFWAPRLTREDLELIVDLDAEGVACVRDLKARGKPIIFITLHYGDWELLGLAMGFYGIPLTVVQEAMRNEAMGNILARLRSRSGHRLVPGRFAATTLLKTLKRGGNIALLIDLNATRKRGGVWLDFFGLPAFSYSAMGALALHSGAAIVPTAATPLPHGRVRIVYGPEITREPTGDYDADVRALNQKCLAFCEDVIRRQPEFWMWSYKRWTPRATAERGRYPAYSRYLPDIAP